MAFHFPHEWVLVYTYMLVHMHKYICKLKSYHGLAEIKGESLLKCVGCQQIALAGYPGTYSHHKDYCLLPIFVHQSD